MQRAFSTASTTATPTRKLPAPSARRTYPDSAVGYLPSAPKTRRSSSSAGLLDPLVALEAEITSTLAGLTPSTLTGHGKPLGGVAVFGGRRAPARRAAFRTPPR